MLAVPPVIPLIHRDLHLDETGIAALSNVPVLVLAGSSVFGALLTTRLGARRALVTGLWVIAIASALRGFGPSAAMLFAMTFVMGAGIAMIQPAFPSLARLWFAARPAFGTAVWANGLLSGEALSASLTLPFVLPLAGGSWEGSFALWSVPVALTAVCIGLVRDGTEDRLVRQGAWLPNFRDPRVWRLGMFQSAASLAYFGANTFLPDFLHATGQGRLLGASLAALNVAQIPASFAVGLIPMRVLARPVTSYLVAALIAVSIVAILTVGGAAIVVAAAILGLASAYVLTLSFALPAVWASQHEVPRVAAGAFTLGYTISFGMSVISGAAWDATHVPAAAFLPLLAATGIVALMGPRLSYAAAP